jgi:uncharacterized protein YciI
VQETFVPYFLCRLVSPRPSFPHDMTAAEVALMQEHASYWMGLVQDGTAVAFGPVFDAEGAWGLGLVEVHGESEAKALTAADPVVRANAGFGYEISPMPQLVLRQGLARQS